MMKKVACFTVLLILTWAIQIVPCRAADGKKLFVDKCGQCHKSGGEASVFAPTKYASMQWQRFFQRNKHQRKKDISSRFSQDELDSIEKYLVDHAADSDQPEAVGLR